MGTNNKSAKKTNNHQNEVARKRVTSMAEYAPKNPQRPVFSGTLIRSFDLIYLSDDGTITTVTGLSSKFESTKPAKMALQRAGFKQTQKYPANTWVRPREVEDVTPEQRKSAKADMFAALYV